VHWSTGGGAILGHHTRVAAVAAATLPDRRVVAVTGGEDGTVRVWDLGMGSAILHPLAVPGSVRGLCLADGRNGPCVVAGDGVACVELHIPSIGGGDMHPGRPFRGEKGGVDG
jgi:hypothetical protein